MTAFVTIKKVFLILLMFSGILLFSNCHTSRKTVQNTAQATTQQADTNRLQIVYYFDALCGWCYGFSPVMQQIEAKYGNQINIEAVSGGLYLGDRIGPINVVAPYIKDGAYKSVEQNTGVKFGKGFLDILYGDGNIVMNSLSPAIALCIVKTEKPELAFQFTATLLNAVSGDGLNPNDMDAIATYATKIGFNKADFIEKMKSEKYKALAEADFQKFEESPFSGMPGVIVIQDGKSYILTDGYTDFETLEEALLPFLSE